jgi:hypothetical protein
LLLQEYEEVRRAFTDNGSPKKSVKYFGTPRREAASKNAELVSPFDSILSDIAAVGSNEDEDLFVKADTSNFYQVTMPFKCSKYRRFLKETSNRRFTKFV